MISFDAEFVEHGQVEVGQGELLEVDVAAPAGVGGDAGGGLVVFVAGTVLELLAVLEAHFLASCKN